MSTGDKKFSFSEFFTEGQYQTQTEVLEVQDKNNNLTIGIPKEVGNDENRLPLVPNSIRTLAGYGHHVIVEKEAGLKSNFTDHDFAEAGADVEASKQRVYESNVIVKASPPTLSEIELMKPGSMLISPILLPNMTEEYLKCLKKKKIIAIAMEYLLSLIHILTLPTTPYV